MGVLKGPRAKLSRAQSQAAELHNELRIALDPNKKTDRLKFDHHRHDEGAEDLYHVTVMLGDMPILADDFGLRLGECLHNFRGSLDHAAWRLVGSRKRNLTTRQLKYIQFPLEKSRGNFTRNVSNRLPGVAPDLITFIEQYQPYRRHNAGRFMRFLRDLTNIDKHRTILVAVNVTPAANFNLTWNPQFRKITDVSLMKEGMQIKTGTKIGKIALQGPKQAKPQMHMQGQMVYAAAFPTSTIRPVGRRVPVGVGVALQGISATTEQIISELEARL